MSSVSGPVGFDMNHISEDELEQYCLDNIPESELAKIEEHLLWCHGCQDRLLVIGHYIKALRGACVRGGFEVEVLAEEYRPKGGRYINATGAEVRRGEFAKDFKD